MVVLAAPADMELLQVKVATEADILLKVVMEDSRVDMVNHKEGMDSHRADTASNHKVVMADLLQVHHKDIHHSRVVTAHRRHQDTEQRRESTLAKDGIHVNAAMSESCPNRYVGKLAGDNGGPVATSYGPCWN